LLGIFEKASTGYKIDTKLSNYKTVRPVKPSVFSSYCAQKTQKSIVVMATLPSTRAVGEWGSSKTKKVQQDQVAAHKSQKLDDKDGVVTAAQA
jgi:hypothetical protein